MTWESDIIFWQGQDIFPCKTSGMALALQLASYSVVTGSCFPMAMARV